MDDLNNIWNTDDELNEEQLLNYLNGKLTEEEANAFEKKMTGSSFINDGIEGLQQFSSAEKINAYAQQVNESLRTKLGNKKARRKYNTNNLSWELIAVISVITLCLLAYVIIALMKK